MQYRDSHILITEKYSKPMLHFSSFLHQMTTHALYMLVTSLRNLLGPVHPE